MIALLLLLSFFQQALPLSSREASLQILPYKISFFLRSSHLCFPWILQGIMSILEHCSPFFRYCINCKSLREERSSSEAKKYLIKKSKASLAFSYKILNQSHPTFIIQQPSYKAPQDNTPTIIIHSTLNIGPTTLFNSFYLEKKRDYRYTKKRLKKAKAPRLVPLTSHLYAFWWSGNLSHYERSWSARILAQNVQKIFKGKKIRLIGHSHGGTIALKTVENLGVSAKDFIEEVLLVGTPIDRLNTLYANHAAKANIKIFNIFSFGDCIQIADPTMGNPGYLEFSKRLIKKEKNSFPLYNLHLALLRENSLYVPGHLEFPGFFADNFSFHSFIRTALRYCQSLHLFHEQGLQDLIYITHRIHALSSEQIKNKSLCFVAYQYSKKHPSFRACKQRKKGALEKHPRAAL